MQGAVVYLGGCLAVTVAAEWLRAVDPPRAEIHTYFASTDRKVLARKAPPGFPTGLLLEGIQPARDGTPVAHGLVLGYAGRAKLDEGVRPSSVYYPPVRAGDLIPGFRGEVCTVGPLAVPGPGEPSTFFFTTLRSPPPGTELQPDGWAVPIKETHFHYGILRVNHKDRKWRLWVDGVSVPAGGKPAAEVTVELNTGTPRESATIRAGDVLLFAGEGRRVSAVVPKDAKTRVIGWVEFDPYPLTPEEAERAVARTGGAVVRTRSP